MQDKERRSHHRFHAHHLKVLVKTSTSDTMDWETGAISSVDFNRFGIGLESSSSFTVGERLSMIIRTDDAAIAEVSGIVCNRKETTNGYRYGVRFEQTFSTNQKNKDITMNKELSIIEKQLSVTVH